MYLFAYSRYYQETLNVITNFLLGWGSFFAIIAVFRYYQFIPKLNVRIIDQF